MTGPSNIFSNMKSASPEPLDLDDSQLLNESLVLLFRIEPNILPDELETTRLQLLKSAKKIGYCFFRDANREIFNEEDLAAIKEAEEEDQRDDTGSSSCQYPMSNYSRNNNKEKGDINETDDIDHDSLDGRNGSRDNDDEYEIVVPESVPSESVLLNDHVITPTNGSTESETPQPVDEVFYDKVAVTPTVPESTPSNTETKYTGNSDKFAHLRQKLSAISSTGAKKSTSGPSEDTSSPTKKISTSSSINSCLEYDGTDEIFTNPDRVGPLFLRRKMTKKKLTAVVSQRKLFLFKEKALVLCDLIHLTSAQDSQIGADIFVEVKSDPKKETRFNIVYSVYGAKTVYEFKALDEADRDCWVKELVRQVEISTHTALTEKQQEEIYEEVKTPHMFRFKMQRGSVCDSSLSSLSLISGSAGDISLLNNSASSNKKSPDIPEKVRKKSLPTTEDDSCIYDIPRPVFRFSSDFEDDLPPPPPSATTTTTGAPPSRHENIYCNFNSNATTTTTRLKTSKSSGNFPSNGSMEQCFQSLPPVRDTKSPLPPPPPPIQPPATVRDVMSPLPPPPPPAPPLPPANFQTLPSNATKGKDGKPKTAISWSKNRRSEEKPSTTPNKSQTSKAGSKASLTRASLSFDDELNLKIRLQSQRLIEKSKESPCVASSPSFARSMSSPEETELDKILKIRKAKSSTSSGHVNSTSVSSVNWTSSRHINRSGPHRSLDFTPPSKSLQSQRSFEFPVRTGVSQVSTTKTEMLRKSTSFRHGSLTKPDLPLKPGGGGPPISSKMFGPVSNSSNNPQPPPPSKLPVRNFHHVSTPSWPRYQDAYHQTKGRL